MKYIFPILFLVSTSVFAQSYSPGLPLPGLPKSLGAKLMSGSTSVTIATDQTSIPVSLSAPTREVRYQDASQYPISGTAGSFTEVGGGYAPFSNTIVQVQVSSTFGQPATIRKAASSTAAATAPDLFIINQGGGPFNIGVSITSGDRLWIRSLSTTGISSQFLTLNFGG